MADQDAAKDEKLERTKRMDQLRPAPISTVVDEPKLVAPKPPAPVASWWEEDRQFSEQW